MISKQLGFNLALAALMIAMAIGLVAARRMGMADAETPTRVSMALIGFGLAFYGNAAPKTLSRVSLRVRRFAGWTFVTTGLASAAIWVLAPLSIAADASMAVVGSGLLATLAYCVWTRRRAA